MKIIASLLAIALLFDFSFAALSLDGKEGSEVKKDVLEFSQTKDKNGNTCLGEDCVLVDGAWTCDGEDCEISANKKDEDEDSSDSTLDSDSSSDSSDSNSSSSDSSSSSSDSDSSSDSSTTDSNGYSCTGDCCEKDSNGNRHCPTSCTSGDLTCQITDGAGTMINNENYETVNLDSTTCPVSIAQYEELLVKSHTYKYFQENLFNNFVLVNGTKDFVGEDGLFESGSTIKIKKEKFEAARDSLDIGLNADKINDSTIKSQVSSKNFSNYISKTNGDFLTHKTYYSQDSDSIFYYLISSLSTQAAGETLAALLSGNFSFASVYPTTPTEQKSLNKKLGSFIYDPYIAYLKTQRVRLLREFFDTCSKKDGDSYLRSLDCDPDQAQMQKLVDTELKIYQLQNLNKSTDTLSIELSSEKVRTNLNTYVYSYLSGAPEEFRNGPDSVTAEEFSRICGSSIDSCPDNLFQVLSHYFVEAANGMEVSVLKTEDLLSQINSEEILNKIQKAYEDLVLVDTFLLGFFELFGGQSVVVDGENENQIVSFPSGFQEILEKGISCDANLSANQIGSALSSFFDKADGDSDALTRADLLDDSGLPDELISGDVSSLDQVEELFDTYQGATTTLEMEPIDIKIKSGGGGGSSSCPFLYSKIDGKTKFLGSFGIQNVFRKLKSDSYEEIASTSSTGVSVVIGEALPETLYLDQLSLLSFEHDSDEKVFLDKYGQAYKVKKSKIKNLNPDSDGEFEFGKLQNSSLLIFRGGLDSESLAFRSLFLLGFYEYLFSRYHFTGEFLAKLLYLALDYSFFGDLVENLFQSFYPLEISYLENGERKLFEKINSYPQQDRAVFLSDSLVGKNLKISYSSLNKLKTSSLVSDFEKISYQEFLPENFTEKLKNADGDLLKLNQGEFKEFTFDLSSLEEKDRTFFLKTNSFYHLFRPKE